jgi:ribosome-binding protein aMBF1 (putative translation factor)
MSCNMRHMTIAADWGTHFKERREDLGLTPDEVADALQKHVATIDRYEAGDMKYVAPETLVRLVAVLRIDCRNLFPQVAA